MKSKLSTLVDKADAAASVYIRMKYADHAGCITCITCGKYMPWKEAHCAHYVERGKKSTRWIEENLHPACPSCNVFRKEFHKRQYTLFMLDTYGRDMIDWLDKLSTKVLSPSEQRNMAEEAFKHFKEAAKQYGTST